MGKWEGTQSRITPIPVLVEVVDQVHQVLRGSVAAGGREVAGGLVAPGAVERVLHQGQELDVGEAHLVHVLGEQRGELPVVEEAFSGLPVPAPGPQVDLIDGHGSLQGVASVARLIHSPSIHW